MSDLNRKTALTTIATLPALAVPAIAAVTPHPDADLLELGRQFDEWEREFKLTEEYWQPRWAVQYEVMAEKLSPTTLHISDEVAAEVERRLGPALKPHPDELCDAASEKMNRQIMALPASTLAGLAVKARVARFACFGFYGASDEDADWEHLMARELIESVLNTVARSA